MSLGTLVKPGSYKQVRSDFLVCFSKEACPTVCKKIIAYMKAAGQINMKNAHHHHPSLSSLLITGKRKENEATMATAELIYE